MQAVIQSIASYLPGAAVTNADLSRSFPEWSVDRIAAKTGIHERHIAAADECSSDLAFHARAEALCERYLSASGH